MHVTSPKSSPYDVLLRIQFASFNTMSSRKKICKISWFRHSTWDSSANRATESTTHVATFFSGFPHSMLVLNPFLSKLVATLLVVGGKGGKKVQKTSRNCWARSPNSLTQKEKKGSTHGSSLTNIPRTHSNSNSKSHMRQIGGTFRELMHAQPAESLSESERPVRGLYNEFHEKKKNKKKNNGIFIFLRFRDIVCFLL